MESNWFIAEKGLNDQLHGISLPNQSRHKFSSSKVHRVKVELVFGRSKYFDSSGVRIILT